MRKFKKICKISIIVLIMLVVILLAYYFANINPVIISNTKLTMDNVSKKAINQGIIEVGCDKALYDELIDISYRDNGDIALIRINTYKANQVCSEIVKSTENNINKLGSNGVLIDTGIFTSIPILSGVGRELRLKFRQVGAVSCVYKSKFLTAGINQNIHRLYVEISTKVGVALPFHTEVVEVNQEVLLCENIIIGDIPYTYLQSTELDSLLNLVPS